MHTYITILRGINLGGINSIKMEALREVLSARKLSNLVTYIQSGNLVYQSTQTDTMKLDELIHDTIQKAFGHSVPVITRRLEDWQKEVAANPFVKQQAYDEKFLHVTFLDKTPQPELAVFDFSPYAPDEAVLIHKAVYLYCPNGYGDTKLSNKFLENKLKVNATTRNWKTTLKLLEMAEA